MLTSSLYDIVLFSYSYLQRFEIMILVNMNILVKDLLALTDKVESFDGHVGGSIAQEEMFQQFAAVQNTT